MTLNLALNKDEERRFISVLKGLAIFLVIVGHVIQHFSTGSTVDFMENPVFVFIYTFHMPLFMLISGYLFSYSFKKRDLKELVIHRCKPLVYTIVVFCIVKYFFNDVIEALLQGRVSVLTDGGWVHSFVEYWFLWSVITCSVVVSVVFKNVDNFFLRMIFLGISCVFVLLIPFWSISLFMLPYFVLGFYYALYRDKISAVLTKLKYFSLVIFPLMIPFYDKRHYIYENGLYSEKYSLLENIQIDIFRWAIGLVGSVFIITVLFLIFKLKPLKKLFDCFEKLGGYTLQIYVYQTIILSGMVDIMLPRLFKAFGTHNFLPENAVLYNAVIVPILSVISTIFFYFMSKWLNKFKFIQAVFGR